MNETDTKGRKRGHRREEGKHMKMQWIVKFALTAAWAAMAAASLPGAVPLREGAVSESDVRQADRLFREGQKKLNQKRLDEAQACFGQALEKFPDLAGARVELGHIRLLRHEYPEAYDEFVLAGEAYSRLQSRLSATQAQKQNETRDFVQAGQDVEARFGTGDCFWPGRIVGGGKEAQQEESRKVGLETGKPLAPVVYFLYLGIAASQTGRAEQAERAFRAGLALKPADAPLHFHLAVVLLAQSRFAEAAVEGRKARQLGFAVPPEFVRDLETRGRLKF